MTSMKSLLLAGSALLASLAAATMMPQPAQAAPAEGAFTVAQAQGGAAAPDKKKEEEKKKKKGAPPHRAPPPNRPKPPAAVQQKPPPPAHRPAPPRPAQAPPIHKPAPPHPAQTAPVHRPAAPHPAQAAPVHKPTPPPAAQKQPAPPPAKQAAPAPKPQRQPAAQQKPQAAPPAPHTSPAQREHRLGPSQQPAPQQAAPATAPNKPAPSKSAAPAAAPGGARTAAPAATQQQPVKPRDAREFIRKDNKQPQRTIKDVRQERRTTRQDGRVSIHEGDRTIVRENNRTIIRHNEDQRFAIGARDVRVERRDGETFTVIERPDSVRIITVTDREGRLIRRVRRDRNGHEVVIIDNRRAGPPGIFIDVRPPRFQMPHDRYIVDADRADEREIYDVLIAPPVEAIDRDYSLAQVRYSAHLRQYMRRLDLDVHFDTGSWQLTPDQMDRLSQVAEALNRAIARNPREVFLIEGHTDAVGSEDDNLSLSDRRAEAVAVALTEAFHVPAENLVTQGYGEQELKVPTQGPSRANRRVAIRRITPLIDRTVRR
jgi:outer membrane protein OmpA-like peptidoglycan-associated protein